MRQRPPNLNYRGEVVPDAWLTTETSLSRPLDERRSAIERGDLNFVLQFELMHAIDVSAKKNGHKPRRYADQDGWYRYDGELDTYYLGLVLAKIASEYFAYWGTPPDASSQILDGLTG